MKLFAFAMAFLVLGLSILPCADVCAMEKANCKAEVRSNHPDGDEHLDTCSPFCACSCCASTNIQHHPNFITDLPFTLAKNAGGHFSSGLVKVVLPIWQPPQLAA